MIQIKNKENIVIWILTGLIGLAALSGVLYFSKDRNFSAVLIPANLQLKASKTEILFNRETDDIRCDKKTLICENMGKMVEYLYNSGVEVPPITYTGLQEDMSKRTNNTQNFKKGEGRWIVKGYGGSPFYQKADKWYQTEPATTSVEAFNLQTAERWWNRLLGQKVLAVTATTSPSAGDGYISNPANDTWAGAHDATDGNPTYTSVNDSLAYALEAGVNHRIARGFTPFDISASIPDNATVNSSTVSLYVTAKSDEDNDGDDYIVAMATTTQASTASLVGADFDNCGSLATGDPNPDEASSRFDITDITTGAYNTWTLNNMNDVSKTGFTLIGWREGHDVENTSMVGADVTNRIAIDFSEQAGTATDPYITVDYTEAAVAVAPQPPQIIIFE